MDNTLTYYEFIFEQPALPEKVTIVASESAIDKIVIKNCNNKDYELQISTIGSLVGEFNNTISIVHFTSDKCHIDNLRIRFPLTNNFENKISPHEISFKGGKAEIINLDKYQSQIEWQEK